MKDSKHILIACGGTGGHLFPGIAVAQELESRGHRATLLISEKKVDARASEKYQGLKFLTVPAVAKPPTFSLQMVSFLLQLWKGVGTCRKLLKTEKVDGVLGMGGFTSFAPVHAAKKSRLPACIHESNAIPGRANLYTAKAGPKVLLGFNEAASYFPKNETIHTGTPVREELVTLPSQAEARQKFGLQADLPVLLVMGGSQGAKQLNSLVADVSYGSGWQVLHLTGEDDFARTKELAANCPNHHVLSFCDEMAYAYAAADFAIIRSGASSLTELARAGLPSLLIPYPFAADDHQTANARVFEKTGASIVIQERELNAARLRTILSEWEDPAGRKAMAAATRTLDEPDAARRIADEVLASISANQ